jgi:hypothetical protein
MSDNEKLFCSNLINRYFDCIRINISVFGKERGVVMCDHIRNYIDNSICDKNDDEINKFIDKMAEELEKNK